MHPAGTIFISAPISGELFIRHLPLGPLHPQDRVSFPVPADGELLVTFVPEEGNYLPLQRRLLFQKGDIVSPLPSCIRAEIWPNHLTTLLLSPVEVPTDFSVYPRVLESREVNLHGTVFTLSRIRREVETLLLCREAQPLAEFSLPEGAIGLEEPIALEPSILAVPLACEEEKQVKILREEPTGWHEILACPGEIASASPMLVFSPAPQDPQARILRQILPERIDTDLELPASPTDPGYLILTALLYGCMDAAQSLLVPDLSAQDLSRYLGPFTRILPCPMSLPVEEDHFVWGICGEENPARVRLFVFACKDGRVTDIYQWE